jgi:UDP-3-O-[3-hydroxymyristoyl] glucosamine N-acyltransferase
MLQYQASANAVRRAALTVEQLARALGAEVATPSSDTDSLDASQLAQIELAFALQRIRPIERVTSLGAADASSLVFVEDQATLTVALGSKAGAILLTAAVAGTQSAQPRSLSPALLVVSQPRLAFARAAQLLRAAESPRSRHPSAFVSVGATLAARVAVGPFAVIEQGAVIGQGSIIGAGVVIGPGVVIGAECRIYPRVVIYAGTQLGDRVVVHAGAVLGSDGFGYVRDEATGAYLQFPQQGTLVIEDDVEIGANTTIDRGALEETRIGRGAKIDNLVHVGHNVQVGANTVIAAQVGISGSSTIGAGAVLAGQVGIGDHAAVGDGVILGGQGGVLPHKSLQGNGQLFWGTPAKPVRQYLRELASVTRLARRSDRKDEG